MFTKNIFNQKPDALVDMIDKINEADYKVKMEALKGNQHKIDKNKNGKVDAHDFKILRGEKKVEEASPFDWKNTPSQLKKKPGETTGHDSKKTSTGTVYTKKAPKKPVEESIEQVDEAMRIVSKHGVGTGEHHAVVKRDPEWNEYQVHFYKGGKHMGEGPVSHHDDKADAQSTADTEVKRMNAKKNEDFNLEDMDPALVEEFMQTEEFEQLDELSKKTLKSYVGKAVDRVSDTQFRAGKHWEKGNKSSADYESRETLKRMRGIHKATGRMAKEDVEQTDEAATMQPKGPARVDVPAYKRVNMKPLSLKDVVTKSTEKKNKLPNAVKEDSEQVDEKTVQQLSAGSRSSKKVDAGKKKMYRIGRKAFGAVKEESEQIGEGERHTLTKKVTNKINRIEKLLAKSAKKLGRTDMGTVMNPYNKSAVAKVTKKASDAQVSDTLNRFSKKNEEVELDEAKGSYELYHSQYSGAVHHGLAHHASKEGLTVHDDDYHHHVSMGPRKPAEGETVSHHLPAKDEKGNDHMIHMQVYNKGGDNKPYELNTYSSKVPKRHVKEDSEQIDELSKKTLRSYFDKSHKDAAQHYKAGEESQKAGDKDGEKTHNKKFQKRIKGQYDAAKRHNSDEYQRQQKLMPKKAKE
jgi:hypothetical protein